MKLYATTKKLRHTRLFKKRFARLWFVEELFDHRLVLTRKISYDSVLRVYLILHQYDELKGIVH